MLAKQLSGGSIKRVASKGFEKHEQVFFVYSYLPNFKNKTVSNPFWLGLLSKFINHAEPKWV
jgi:hypothetical protein